MRSTGPEGAARRVARWLVGAALLAGCGREDVELGRAVGAGGSGATNGTGGNGSSFAADCSAEVPQDLLASRPPMGWNGYNAFGDSEALNEAKVQANAAALIESGMQAAGYEYVILDRGWQLPRSSAGTRVFDPERLPGGIEALSQSLRDRGLRLGTWAPITDCLGEPGGASYEAVDAQTYASLGIDYVKYVACDVVDRASVERLAEELNNASPPIVLSLATPSFEEWMPRAVQLWRTGHNATPDWSYLVEAIDTTTPLAAYARAGAFNDPDMLEIGNGTLTEGEQRVHFAVWSILAAPLMAGNDLSTMSETTRAILTNSAIIALDQDPLGLQGAVVRREGDVDVLAKPLAECGARGVVLWNRGTSAAQVTLRWSDLWLTDSPATVEDLWSHTELASDATSIELEVPGHDALALRVTGGEPALPKAEAFLSDLDWTYAVNGFGPIERDTSNGEELPGDGAVMSLRGAVHDKGLGVHAPSLIRYRLAQKCTRFVADVGIDDEVAGGGSVRFEVWADGIKLFESGLMTGESPPRRVDVDLTGRRDLRLFIDTGGDTNELDHANWASARFFCDEAP